MRTFLAVLLFFLSTSAFAQYESKIQAIEYLNNSNHWVAGLPDYTLDNARGILTIVVHSNQISSTFKLPLGELTVTEDTKMAPQVFFTCKDNGPCIDAQNRSTHIKTDQLRLIIESAFARDGSGEYAQYYPERAFKLAEAVGYLNDAYKPSK